MSGNHLRSPVVLLTLVASLIVHGDADTSVPIDQGETMYAALTKAGVPTSFIRIKGAGHGFEGAATSDLEVPERRAAFFWIGGYAEAMLGLWSMQSAPLGLSLHLAFKTSIENVTQACARLRAQGVTPLSFFGTETEEPSVIGWMPAAAVYFRDPDGHLLEYLAMLDERPRPDRGIVSWSEWRS